MKTFLKRLVVNTLNAAYSGKKERVHSAKQTLHKHRDQKLQLRENHVVSQAETNKTNIPIVKLAWPIWVENMLRISLASVDVFMVGFYSEKAVAGVGLALQFVMFIQIIYLMVAFGTSILLSQNLGANRMAEARAITRTSFVLMVVFAVLLSIALYVSIAPILGSFGLDVEVHKYARQFLEITTIFSIFMAFGIMQSTILRTYGYTYESMIVGIACNILNVFGNAICIFGLFGFPVTGVVGVAYTTIICQAIGCAILAWRIKLHSEIGFRLKELAKIDLGLCKRILAVGGPTAGEYLSYNIGQIVIMRMIATMGTETMTAFMYAMTILRYVFITSVSIGNATQIKVGYLVGAGLYDRAYRNVYQYFWIGVCISLFLVSVLYVLRFPIISIFTQDAAIISVLVAILPFSLILEPGRNFNVIIIPGLKGAGDVVFPVAIGMIFMWGVGVVLAYVLGITLKMGLVGVWIALVCDEWIRGTTMLLRWRGGKWRTKRLIPAECGYGGDHVT